MQRGRNAPCRIIIMLIKVRTKWDDVRDFINVWLKDPTRYCANCDTDFREEFMPCCEKPVIGDNASITKYLIQEVKEDRKNLEHNEYAASKTMTFRATTRIPTRLYHNLNNLYKLRGEKLFNNQDEMREFCHQFPMFVVPTRM